MTKISTGAKIWNKMDAETVAKFDNGVEKVDHAASAKANLIEARDGFVEGITMPFTAPFGDKDGFGAPMDSIGHRVFNTALSVVAAPLLVLGSAKNGVDAALHGIANLFD